MGHSEDVTAKVELKLKVEIAIDKHRSLYCGESCPHILPRSESTASCSLFYCMDLKNEELATTPDHNNFKRTFRCVQATRGSVHA